MPVADTTDHITLRPNFIAHEVIYDAVTKKATGVKVIAAETKETILISAKVVFLCGSFMASVAIL